MNEIKGFASCGRSEFGAQRTSRKRQFWSFPRGAIMSVIRFTPRDGVFALLGFARIHLPALIYAGRQGLRAGFEAILGLALSGADRRHAPAIIYAMVSELVGFGELLGIGRREGDCC
jgi:hypothetical protein